MADAIDELIKSREQKLFLSGMWASLYPLAVGVRDAGYSGQDLPRDNTLLTGGGLKGAQLPPDYPRDRLRHLQPVRASATYQFYSMQEINTPSPGAAAGRYHVAALGDRACRWTHRGEHLLDASEGEVEGRAAFFDLSLDGRWGGVISGDRVTVDFRPCACGHQGPTIGPDIVRYADLEGGDKISCAGTIDAYVEGRGV